MINSRNLKNAERRKLKVERKDKSEGHPASLPTPRQGGQRKAGCRSRHRFAQSGRSEARGPGSEGSWAEADYRLLGK